MGIDGLPLAPTWPKKAKQLAKKGRAEWVDNDTIRLLDGPPAEMRVKDMPDETNARTEWAEYFKKLAEQLITNDEIAKSAIEAIKTYSNRTNLPAGDHPGQAIGGIVHANQNAKAAIFRSMTEFTTSMITANERASASQDKTTMLEKLMDAINGQHIDPVIKADKMTQIAEALVKGTALSGVIETMERVPNDAKLKIAHLKELADSLIGVQQEENEA